MPRASVIVAVCAIVSFSGLGCGWAALRQARARGSPLLALTHRSVELLGALTSDPKAQPIGWSASFDVGVVVWDLVE